MFFIHAAIMIAAVMLLVWMMVGDEIVSSITSSLDYLMNPTMRKLRQARRVIGD